MRRLYRSQEAPPKGTYWDFRNWKVEVVTKDGQVLPGLDSHLYLRLRFFELILCIGVISIVFVLSLPALGFIMMLITLGAAVAVFLLQKVFANLGRQECRAEACVCGGLKRYFCKHVDDENLTFAVRGLFISATFLLGGIASRLLFC